MLQVDEQRSKQDFLQEISQRTRKTLRKEKIAFQSIAVTKNNVVVGLHSKHSKNNLEPVLKKLSLSIPDQNQTDIEITIKQNKLTLTPAARAIENLLSHNLIGASQLLKNRLAHARFHGYVVEPDGRSRLLIKIPNIKKFQDFSRDRLYSFPHVFVVQLTDESMRQNDEFLTPPLGMKTYKAPTLAGEKFLGIARPVVTGKDLLSVTKVKLESGKEGLRLSLRAEVAAKGRYQSRIGVRLGLIVDNAIVARSVVKLSIPIKTLDFELLDEDQDIEALAGWIKGGFYPGKINVISEKKCFW